MGHNPVDTQTKLSPNGTLHYYVGPAPSTKQGILLYNPKTKLISIRRIFQQLNLTDPTVPVLPIQITENEPPETSHETNLPATHNTIFNPTTIPPTSEINKLAALLTCPEENKTNIDYFYNQNPTSSISDHTNTNPSISPSQAPKLIPQSLVSSPELIVKPPFPPPTTLTNYVPTRRNPTRIRNLPNRFAALAEADPNHPPAPFYKVQPSVQMIHSQLINIPNSWLPCIHHLHISKLH